jgi:hypothetical protein
MKLHQLQVLLVTCKFEKCDFISLRIACRPIERGVAYIIMWVWGEECERRRKNYVRFMRFYPLATLGGGDNYQRIPVLDVAQSGRLKGHGRKQPWPTA